MKAFVLAAGLGTRLRPWTDNKPKALVEYHGKPLLQILLEKLKSHGFTDIVINVHYLASQIIDYLAENQNFGLNIAISDETNELLDTGGAISKAKDLLNDGEPFLVHNVDIVSDLDLKVFYDSFNPQQALAQLAVQQRHSSRMLSFSIKGKYLCAWKNIKTGQIRLARTDCTDSRDFAFSGIHVLSPKVFELLPAGKFSIIDFYLKVAKDYLITYYDHSGGFWKDMGTPASFRD